MNCKNATRLISESQDRALSASEKLTLRVHLLMCSGCRNFNRQVPFLSQVMRAYAQGQDDKAPK